MPDQAITQRQVPGHLISQGSPGSPGGTAALTQQQLQELRAVAEISLGEYDLTYRQLKGYLERGGRSPEHQKWLTDKAAHVLYGYEQAHDVVISLARQDVVKHRPKDDSVRTVYIEQPRKPWYHLLTGG